VVEHRSQGGARSARRRVLGGRFGGNYVYVDREHDLVIVLRWVPEFDKVIPAFLEALRG